MASASTPDEAPGSPTLFTVSTRPSKSLAAWFPARNGSPPEIRLYLGSLAEDYLSPDWQGGDEAAPLTTALAVYSLLELICMTRSQEAPRTRRRCQQHPHCPPERLAFEMLRYVM